MQTIEVDFDVFKELTMRRQSEDVTYNDVLRKLLGLATKNLETRAPQNHAFDGSWYPKGVAFPSGTEFRSRYKGQLIQGKVESGRLKVNGNQYDSPSAAAVAMTGKPTNGWTFWECRMPGQMTWRVINDFRK